MDDEIIDYSIWAAMDSWSMKETISLIGSYFKLLMHNGAIEVTKYNQENVVAKFNSHIDAIVKNVLIFSPEIIYIQSDNIDADKLDSDKIYYNLIDGDDTRVNVYNFIRWAYSEQIPLPEEFVNVIKGNSSSNEVKPITNIKHKKYIQWANFGSWSLISVVRLGFCTALLTL
jgi:intein-encoded DNA endonuclease-like protein